jgi:hypothetical protein
MSFGRESLLGPSRGRVIINKMWVRNGKTYILCNLCNTWYPVHEDADIEWLGTKIEDYTKTGMPTSEYVCASCSPIAKQVLRRLV